MIESIRGWWDQGVEVALRWLQSPAAWSQFGLLVAAFVLAWAINRWAEPRLRRLLTPEPDNQGLVAQARRFAAVFLPLLLPLLAYGLTAAGELVTRTLFGSGAVIAFGKRVFLFLAARAFARDMLTDPFLRLLGRYVLVPVAGLYALGVLGPVREALAGMVVPLGNLSFSVLWLIQFAVVGSVIFWFGRWSNERSAQYIQKREEMRPATRQLAVKAAEIAIFGAAFLVLMNIMGVSLTSLTVLSGAIGVGLGFGLQKIASNFASGVILLLEGQATVGDYVRLDGGEEGTIIKMMARAVILQTFDGRWILVPNEDFIVTRVTNFSDSGSAKRYEVEFSVHYNSDLEQVCEVVNKAVAAYDKVLLEPEVPDTEVRAFGESGIDLAVEFWCEGLDDGPNRYTADVRMIVWKALREAGIQMPYPQRVVHLRDDRDPAPAEA